jgi:hypothetical protein
MSDTCDIRPARGEGIGWPKRFDARHATGKKVKVEVEPGVTSFVWLMAGGGGYGMLPKDARELAATLVQAAKEIEKPK